MKKLLEKWQEQSIKVTVIMLIAIPVVTKLCTKDFSTDGLIGYIGDAIGAVSAIVLGLIAIGESKRSQDEKELSYTLILTLDLESICDFITKECLHKRTGQNDMYRAKSNVRYIGDFYKYIADCPFLDNSQKLFLVRLYGQVYNYNIFVNKSTTIASISPSKPSLNTDSSFEVSPFIFLLTAFGVEFKLNQSPSIDKILDTIDYEQNSKTFGDIMKILSNRIS